MLSLWRRLPPRLSIARATLRACCARSELDSWWCDQCGTDIAASELRYDCAKSEDTFCMCAKCAQQKDHPHELFEISGALHITELETVLCPNNHLVIPKGQSDSGWACDNAPKWGGAGCLRGCTDFDQSASWGQYKCADEQCGYCLCDLCYEAALPMLAVLEPI